MLSVHHHNQQQQQQQCNSFIRNHVGFQSNNDSNKIDDNELYSSYWDEELGLSKLTTNNYYLKQTTTLRVDDDHKLKQMSTDNKAAVEDTTQLPMKNRVRFKTNENNQIQIQIKIIENNFWSDEDNDEHNNKSILWWSQDELATIKSQNKTISTKFITQSSKFYRERIIEGLLGLWHYHYDNSKNTNNNSNKTIDFDDIGDGSECSSHRHHHHPLSHPSSPNQFEIQSLIDCEVRGLEKFILPHMDFNKIEEINELLIIAAVQQQQQQQSNKSTDDNNTIKDTLSNIAKILARRLAIGDEYVVIAMIE